MGRRRARILAAVKLPISKKMGAKESFFGDFAQRKCPVFLTTYARFGKLCDSTLATKTNTSQECGTQQRRPFHPTVGRLSRWKGGTGRTGSVLESVC
jgi:hypothetical protein